jgi:protocatechuate 3,4-dioxygenase beta subunit
MIKEMDDRRRAVLRALLAVPAMGVFRWGAGEAEALAPTPQCADGDEPTPWQGAGPFFKPQSPQRTALVEAGQRQLVLSGVVLSTACTPVPKALLDFWHADEHGEYDMGGFRLRGHQFSDPAGRFRLETIVPAAYSGRTRHIHVRVQAPSGPLLTTQLYFPDERGNEGDGMFDRRLLMTARKEAAGLAAGFTFVVRT